jgi:hypothetical protein
MAVGGFAAMREVLMKGIHEGMEQLDKDLRTPEGREKLAQRADKEARRLTEGALHPRYPLPPDVVKSCLDSAERSRAWARELRARVSNEGLYEIRKSR